MGSRDVVMGGLIVGMGGVIVVMIGMWGGNGGIGESVRLFEED